MSSTLSATGISERPSGLSQRYARALYELADEQKQIDRTVAEMEALGALIARSETLRRLIESRTIGVAEAGRAMDAALASQGFSDLVKRFVAIATANRRLRDLPGLVSGFAAYVAERRGIVVAEVTSAHELTDTQRNQLAARLAEAGYGDRVAIRETVDPSLLGGMSVKIGSRLYDTSLKSRLQRLRHVMKGAA